jgi:7,8-dihydropterin-6-yl-methyl-4-(beta-D-ribofuranosyl)aminobenzene 5'-phosphate synthase
MLEHRPFLLIINRNTKTDFGLVVILGCGHRDMINTIRHARKLTGKEKVYAVIGGTHLMWASEEQINGTITDLTEMNIVKLGVSHCTGFEAAFRLSSAFPEAFFLNNAGTKVTLP